MSSKSAVESAIEADIELKRERMESLTAEIQALVDERGRVGAEAEQLQSALLVMRLYGQRAEQRASMATEAPAASTQEILDAALNVLKRGARPMHTADIHDQLIGGGMKIGGADPQQYLSSILSRNKDACGIEASRRDGWSLKRSNSASEAADAGMNGAG